MAAADELNDGSPPVAGRFVWPPRRVPSGSPAVAAPPAAPPATARPVFQRDPPPRPSQPPAPRRSFWRDFEHTWLDPVALPLARRAAELGWAPDLPSAYCPRCGTTSGPHESDAATGCPACRGKQLRWDRFIRLGSYVPPLSTFVQEVKFTRWRRLGVDLGALLGRSVLAELQTERKHTGPHAHQGPSSVPQIAIVPVPTSFRRRLSRGIDHPYVIASGLARTLRAAPVLANCQIRVVDALWRQHRPSQLAVPASRRPSNVAGTIHPRRGIDLAGGLVIVVDDVVTTGATMRAACRAITQAGPAGKRPRLWAAVLARTPIEGRAGGAGDQGVDLSPPA